MAVKVGFPLRREYLRDGLLDESVQHRGNAQGAGLPVWFRNFHAPHRLRRVGARNQLGAQDRPVVSEVLGEFIDCHAVDAWRALVTAYLL